MQNSNKDLIGKEFKVLDKGSIQVVDLMGDDSAIVQAARVSYGKGTKKVSTDRHLVRYLMRHRHSTPFEMCEIKLRVVVPMDCWRQWIRHRTANVNEYSTRYSEAIEDMQRTPVCNWRKQSKNNKQGSAGHFDAITGHVLNKSELELQDHARVVYLQRLELGVAREQARKDLPLSTYTVAYWKVDLHNLLHFLSLRMDPHAQQEIREYATIIGEEIVAKWVPNTWEAFKQYRLDGMYLTSLDVGVISMLNDSFSWEEACEQAGWTTARCRERDECFAKLEKLGWRLDI